MINRSWRPKKEPWMPVDYDDDVIYAVRAVEKGIASPSQQKLFWDWIMYVTGAGEQFQDISFRPGADGVRATDFAEGRRFIGQQVRKMLRPELTPKPKEETDPSKRAKKIQDPTPTTKRKP